MHIVIIAMCDRNILSLRGDRRNTQRCISQLSVLSCIVYPTVSRSRCSLVFWHQPESSLHRVLWYLSYARIHDPLRNKQWFIKFELFIGPWLQFLICYVWQIISVQIKRLSAIMDIKISTFAIAVFFLCQENEYKRIEYINCTKRITFHAMLAHTNAALIINASLHFLANQPHICSDFF